MKWKYSSAMEFIESERGNQKLSYQGFLYVKQKKLANGVVSWECEQRWRNSCNAKIKVRGEEIVGNVNTHNYAAEPCRKETLQIKNTIKRRAIDTDARINIININKEFFSFINQNQI